MTSSDGHDDVTDAAAIEAARRAAGETAEAARRLWARSRHDQALRDALVRVACWDQARAAVRRRRSSGRGRRGLTDRQPRSSQASRSGAKVDTLIGVACLLAAPILIVVVPVLIAADSVDI